MNERRYEGWVAVYRSGKDYESELVRDKLEDAGIPAVIMSKRDHAFNLNVGSLSDVFVMVRPDDANKARSLLAEKAISSRELEELAMASAPDVDGPDISDDDEPTST